MSVRGVRIVPDSGPPVTLVCSRDALANALSRTSLLSDWYERADRIIELLGGER